MLRRGIAKEIPALLIRGGTSKGVYFNDHEFPAPRGSHERDALIRRCFGVPDKTGMQLDGLGGGISSTSKVVFVSKSSKDGFDIDYDFGQVGLTSGDIDWTGNCGNLSSGLLIAARQFGLLSNDATIANVWQVNVKETMLIEEKDEQIIIPGVPGAANRVDVSFLGAPNASILPTGNVHEELQGHICTLVKGSNPTVFFAQEVFDKLGLQSKPDAEYFSWIEGIRKEAASRMGVALSDALRVSFVSPPKPYTTASGQQLNANAYDVFGRITTPNRRFHHAFTGTGAVNLAMASRIPGTTVHDQLVQGGARQSSQSVRMGHPGGVMELNVSVRHDAMTGTWLGSVKLTRSARLLMRGFAAI